MPRHNKRKKIRHKEYPMLFPAPEKGKGKAPPIKEPKTAPPTLAVFDADIYGETLPELPGTPQKTSMPAVTTQLKEESKGPVYLVPAGVGEDRGGKLTVAIVNYEHWFYSMWSEFGIRPNFDEWFGLISGNELLDVRVYGDFSKDDICRELARIRCFTTTVIDTRNPNGKVEKDFTDFIILNDLYRIVWQRRNIGKVILLTGDGHFAPAVSFLRTVCGAEVEVYGVKGCINTSLWLSATALHELPGSLDYLYPCCQDILTHMDKVRQKAAWYNFFFLPLAEQVADYYGYSLQIAKDALETLIRQGYLYRDVRYINGQEKSILKL